MTLSPFEALGYGTLLVSALMAVLWLVSLRIKDAGIVDVGWAAGLGILAVFYALAADGDASRRIVVACLGGLWSFRLAYYLLFDRVVGKNEDGRYKYLREHWGANANRNFFWFFQAQAALDVLLSLSFLPLVYNFAPMLSWWEYAGIAIWFISVGGESIADMQLARFRANVKNKGKTCRSGLWRYSRHPNYFFEWLHWFSYAFIGVASPFGFLTFIAPVLMLIFILKFTGIPYTEKQALKSRGEDYRRYQETTNAFFPWRPRTSL